MNHTALAVRTAAIAVLLLAALALPAASVITVNWNGTGDYTAIWAATTAASEGDTISVAPGTYTGVNNNDVNTYGKNLVFESEGGAAVTIIDGDDERGAFYITSGQDTTTVIRGFTLSNFHRGSNGGAFEIANSSPIIEGCVITDCTSGGNGGVISFFNSSAIVRDCVFSMNLANYRAGAIYEYSGAATVSRCLFDDNWASPSYGGSAVFLNASSGLYSGCTIVNNTHDAVQILNCPSLRVANCIIAGTINGRAVVDNAADGTEVSHCVIFGNANGDSLTDHRHDNLFVNPLFCDASSDDYTHCSDSQCLPAMNSWGELIGMYGDGCGPCDTPVEEASWGSLKALFR